MMPTVMMGKELVPLNERYERVMSLIGADGDPDKREGKFKKYREKLFGPQVIEQAPSLYWDMLLVNDLQWKPEEWESMDVHSRAKVRAARRIKGMVDVLQRHDELQAEAQNKAMGK